MEEANMNLLVPESSTLQPIKVKIKDLTLSVYELSISSRIYFVLFIIALLFVINHFYPVREKQHTISHN